MKMAFGGGIPSPIVPDPDYSALPGPKTIIGVILDWDFMA